MARRSHSHRRDHFARRAQQENRPARSVYKLEEIDRRWHILKAGDRVVDLGCAPGSWLQYTADRVGPNGSVTGLDRQPLSISLPPNADVHQADVTALSPELLPNNLDVVLSDMAPATMGNHTTDALRSAALAETALQIADQYLRAGGHVVVKILEGGEVPQLLARMRQSYQKVEQLRPRATRKRSTEIFLVGLKKKYSFDRSSESEERG